MLVGELKSVLERLEQLYRAGGAKGAANDVRAVTKLLEGHEADSLDAFIAETKALIGKSEPSPARLNEKAAKSYGEALLEAEIDQERFQATLSVMDNDASLGLAEWQEIANIYRNAPTGSTHRYKFTSIKAARNAILDTFGERLESASKRDIIERITQWGR